MPTDMSPATIAVICFEAAIFLFGLWALWRFQLSAAARAKLALPQPLGSWELSTTMFMQTAICVIGGAILTQGAIVLVLRRYFPAITADLAWWTVLVSMGPHLGALVGIIVSRFLPDFFDPLPAAEPPILLAANARLPKSRVVLGGIIAFAVAIPLVELLAALWQLLLGLFNIPFEKQELLDIFAKTRGPVRLTMMILFTVVVAPIAEELIFRAGIFRWLRSKIDRRIAVGVSALIFAVIHANLLALPALFILGVVFALAYERTGRILVPVIAHSLFNLNTVVLVLMGVTV